LWEEVEIERRRLGAASVESGLGRARGFTLTWNNSLDLLCESERLGGSTKREKGATSSFTLGDGGEESATDTAASVVAEEVATEAADVNELYEPRRARPDNGRNALAKKWPIRVRGRDE